MCGAGDGDDHHFAIGTTTRLLHLAPEAGIDRAVCSVCNEGASNITPDRPSLIKLKAQIRKARGDDQVALLRWPSDKYPDQIGTRPA